MRYWSPFLILGLLVVPPLLQADDKIPDKGKSYHVPYRLTDTAHVLVRVKINGKGPYNYIIDTGAPATFIATKVAKEIGLEADKKSEAIADSFVIEGGVANKKVTLKVHTPFQLEGMNAMNFAGVELHGIIGYDLLARYKMEFDFERPKMKWTRLDFNPPPPKFLKVKGGAPAELSAMGGLMKILSMFVGKRVTPKAVPGGYLGIELGGKKNEVSIEKVYPKSPAAKAGLKVGDRVLQVDGEKVRTTSDIMQQTKDIVPGAGVEFLIERDGKEQKVIVTAGEGL